MKKLVLAAAILAAFSASFAHSEDAKPEEKKPDNEISYNAALSSDYRFRGISQSRLDPALSGGADYTNNPTGFYLGTWLSTIKWTKELGGDGHLEVDVYGGKRGEITKDISYDVGVLTYYYPSNHLQPNANTTEIYGQIGYGVAYAKYSSTLTNAFGASDSKNSGYLDLGANIEVPMGVTVNLHAGHQTVKGHSDGNYTDYKIGATKDFGFATGAVAVIGTDANNNGFYIVNGKHLGKTTAVVSISKTF
jgi:uncharacterized protein (TIGR02001 family)